MTSKIATTPPSPTSRGLTAGSRDLSNDMDPAVKPRDVGIKIEPMHVSNFKPYRLINDLELQMLQQMFERKLQDWNKEHALFPLTCRLGLGPKKPFHRDHCWAKAQPTFKTDAQDLSTIKHSLFGNESNCFNELAETLFMELLNQLLGNQLLDPIENWFYPGTSSLTLTLSCADKTMTIYLHPQWVLNALPQQPSTKNPTVRLDEALATRQVNLNVELNPLPLKLADIMRLQVGDVIKTDQPITEPALLTHQQQSLCKVNIGATHSFKSIQITRTS